MNLLFCASEAAPFCKTGGLADVAGALPKALADLGLEVSVVLPLYDAVPDWARREMTFVRMLHVPLAWRNQTCGIFSLQRDGVTWYFLDNGYYFRRRDLYGHYDDGERFAFFSKAVVDMIPALELDIDIIHANDWQTALIPVYLKCLYGKDPRYAGLRTVFTIHNIAYQGAFPRGFLSDVAGIDDAFFRSGLLAYNDGINLLKSAIVLSDALTTVSPTYARELLTAYYGCGLTASCGRTKKSSPVSSTASTPAPMTPRPMRAWPCTTAPPTGPASGRTSGCCRASWACRCSRRSRWRPS